MRKMENAEFDWAMPYFLTHDLVSKYLSFATLSRMKAKFCITAETIELPSGIFLQLRSTAILTSLHKLTIVILFNRDSDSLEQSFHHFLLPHEIHFQKEFSGANLPFIPPNIIIS